MLSELSRWFRSDGDSKNSGNKNSHEYSPGTSFSRRPLGRAGFPNVPSGDISRIALVLDEYVHLRGLGQQPERNEFLARHAAIADELADCLDGLDFVLSARDDDLLATDDPEESGGEDRRLSERLGDYRLIREVGRGGMGVVYEAEQLSLRAAWR